MCEDGRRRDETHRDAHIFRAKEGSVVMALARIVANWGDWKYLVT